MVGTAWNALELVGTAIEKPPAPSGNEPHLAFGKNGHVSGADGCNRFTGPYTLKKPNGVSFGTLAGTRMACTTGEEMAQRFRNVLKGTSHWDIINGRLELYGATGKPLGVFERRPADAPAR